MAAREINLIHERKIFTPFEERFIHDIYKALPYVLGSFALILILTFSISFYINRTLNKLDQDIASEKDQIRAKEKDEGRYLLLKQKASALSQIINTQYPYADFFNYIKSLTGADVLLNDISMAANGNVILSVTVKNTEVLDTFIKTILTDADSRFRQIELSGLEFNGGSDFTIQLAIITQGKI